MTEIELWINENSNKYVCNCGCNKFIPVTKNNFRFGIPKHLNGHSIHNSKKSVYERRLKKFWDNVKITDSCWLWIEDICKGGYGAAKFGLAHRFSWTIHNGPIPVGMYVLHNCQDGDNPKCVNPKHLWIGTQLENIQDRNNKGRTRSSIGIKNSKARLTEEQVLEIRRLYATGEYKLYRTS